MCHAHARTNAHTRLIPHLCQAHAIPTKDPYSTPCWTEKQIATTLPSSRPFGPLLHGRCIVRRARSIKAGCSSIRSDSPTSLDIWADIVEAATQPSRVKRVWPGVSQTILLRSRMERDMQAQLLRAFRDVDPAGLIDDATLRRLVVAAESATVVVVAQPHVIAPRPACVGCGRPAHPRPDKQVKAVVLDVTGLRSVVHEPARCQSSSCAVKGKYVWQNFVSLRKGCREWRGSPPSALEYIMLSPDFGVAQRWHHQFTQRLLHQYASFQGEAEVHARPWRDCGAVPEVGGVSVVTLKRNIRRAWFLVALLKRCEEMSCLQGFRMDTSVAAHIERIFPAYEEHMRQRRCHRVVRELGAQRVVVIDGHQKLTRRVCAELWATQMHSVPELGARCLVQCPVTPVRGSHFCAQHQATSPDMTSCDAKGMIAWRLKVPLARSSEGLVDVGVRGDTSRVRYHPLSAFPVADIRIFRHRLSQLALESPPREKRPGSARDSKGVDMHVDDVATTSELSCVLCQTHKMGLPARKRKAANVETSGAPGGDSADTCALSLWERMMEPFDPEAAEQETRGLRQVGGQTIRSRRSGGWLVACLPQGGIVDLMEFYGSESLTQRYLFVARLRRLLPLMEVVVHDDACHLRRYAERRASWGDFASSLAHPRIHYLIDRFHARGHIDPWCLKHCHPESAEASSLLQGLNTSVCEWTFQWLGRYKHMYRKMSRWTGAFFVTELIDARNEHHFASKGSVEPQLSRMDGGGGPNDEEGDDAVDASDSATESDESSSSSDTRQGRSSSESS